MNQIVAFDVETPNSSNNRICSIGLTVINDGIITDTLHYLINPETHFDQRNINIHGIKPSDVSNASVFPVIWDKISGLFKSSLIAAHNATFDLCVLRKTLLAYGIYEPLVYYVCTMQMAKSAIKDINNYQLSTLACYSGIELQHHNAQSDSYCCAEILRVLLEQGINLDNHTRSFDLAMENEETKTPRTKYLTDKNQALNSLKDLLSALTCDKILNEQEILFLQNWLDNNRELSGNFPYDKIFYTVSNALADGILEQNELDSMLNLFMQVSDPVGSLCNNCESIDIKDKNIVLTGDFDRGDRKSLEIELKSFGAICDKNVTKRTDYVIVGGQGSSAWSAGNYGNKVKKALELQAKGNSIEIIRESDFYNGLGV